MVEAQEREAAVAPGASLAVVAGEESQRAEQVVAEVGGCSGRQAPDGKMNAVIRWGAKAVVVVAAEGSGGKAVEGEVAAVKPVRKLRCSRPVQCATPAGNSRIAPSIFRQQAMAFAGDIAAVSPAT